jgi:hypothetical protein
MERKTEENSTEMAGRILIRWMVLQVLGATLIAMGLFIEWPPPQEANLPDTSSFLIIVGGLLGVVGFLAALRRE